MDSKLRNQALSALESDFRARILKHRVNVENYLQNGVGVAEHPDVLSSIEEELNKLAEARDLLETLNHFGSENS